MASLEIQIASIPTTEDVTTTFLQWLFATTGVPTDYNIGSSVRTFSEAVGSVCEIEGIETQSQALQALVYSAYAAFGITPEVAEPSVGSVNFFTLSFSPLPPNVSVFIPSGTLIQTNSGTQFNTTSSVVLVSGTSIVTAPIQSVQVGSATNVASGTITQVITGLSYPLGVINPAPTAGGQDAETASQTLARFTAYVNSLGLCSPIAVASAVINVNYNQEFVKYSTVFEPWVAEYEGGDPTPTAGFQVIIDNGSGAASNNLINAVTNYLNSGNGIGYRPAGVPFSVLAVTPVYSTVVVSANSVNPSLAISIQTAVTQAIISYFDSLNFGNSAQLTNLTAQIANATFGQLTSLSIQMLDITNTPQTVITTSPVQRMILLASNVIIN